METNVRGQSKVVKKQTRQEGMLERMAKELYVRRFKTLDDTGTWIIESIGSESTVGEKQPPDKK